MQLEVIKAIKNGTPLEQEPTTKNDLALIHTEGLDEEIRCTMCTNHMKSDRGCDGSCVVNKDMYKAVIDAIEKRIQPTTKNDLGVDCISREAVERIINKWLSHSDYELKDHIYSMTEKIHNLPSITPQPCEDAVSRQAVLELIADYDLSMGQMVRGIHALPSVTPQEPIIDKINKMKSEIADSLEFWDYSPNNNPLARDMLETLTHFFGDMREVEK